MEQQKNSLDFLCELNNVHDITTQFISIII